MIASMLIAMSPPALPPRKPFGDLLLRCEMHSAAQEKMMLDVGLRGGTRGGVAGYFWTITGGYDNYPAPAEAAAFAPDNPDIKLTALMVSREGSDYIYEVSLDGLERGDLVDKFGSRAHLTVYSRAASQYYGLKPVGIGFCDIVQKG